MKTRLAIDNRILWFCPGCKCVHQILYGQGDGPRWTWNLDRNKPTFQPSVLVTYSGEESKDICHSFVVDGQMQFLSDCTHELAGKTIEIPEWPYNREKFHISGEIE